MVEGPKFELVEFEQVEAAHGTVLLRIAARVASDWRRASPRLIVRSGAARQIFSPLPAPPGFADLLRLSYPVPARLAGPEATFTLEFTDGTQTELSAPTRHEGAPRPPQPEGETPLGWEERLRAESRHVALVELERRLELEQNRRRTAEAEAEAHATSETELSQRLESVTAEASQLRTEFEEERSRARAAAASADAARRELEHELQEATDAVTRSGAEIDALRSELHEHEERLSTRTAEIEQLRGELAQRTEESDGLRGELAELREDAAAHQERITQLERELEQQTTEHHQRLTELEETRAGLVAEFEERISHLGSELERTRAELSSAETRGSELEDELRNTRERLDGTESQLADRTAELSEANRGLEELRERVREHEQRASELAQQLWSAGELQAAVEAHVIARGVEADLLRTSVHEWEREAAMARAETQELKRATAELDLELSRVNQELAQAREHVATVETRAEAGPRSEVAMDTLRQEVRRAQQRAGELETQLRRAWDAQAAAEARAGGLADEIRQLREELGRHGERTEELEGELATRNVEIGLLRDALDDPERRETANERAAELERQLGELQQRLDAALSEAAEHRERSAQLEREVLEHQSQMASAIGGIEQTGARVEELAEIVRTETEHRERADAELAEARRRVITLEQARQAVKDERDGLAEKIREQADEIAHLWAGRTEVEHALARWQLVHQESLSTIETLRAESAQAIERYAQEAAAREAVNSLLDEIGRRGQAGG